MARISVPLSTLSDVLTRALVRWPEHERRIHNAAMLLVLGHVTRTATGEYAVTSQATPASQSYYVTAESCACQDRQRHPERACKHIMSVRLLEIAEERQRRLDLRSAFTPRELERLTSVKRRRAAQTA